jgi:hypothetical protein
MVIYLLYKNTRLLNMSENIQVRQIPKKTIIWFGVMIILAIGIYTVSENTRVHKAQYILDDQGYKNISNLKVYSKQKFEEPDTMIEGFQYFVKFRNNDTNQDCKGFVLRNFKNVMDKDIICGKGK